LSRARREFIIAGEEKIVFTLRQFVQSSICDAVKMFRMNGFYFVAFFGKRGAEAARQVLIPKDSLV